MSRVGRSHSNPARQISNADLLRVLSAPVKRHDAPLLGEGTHIDNSGSEFIIAWLELPYGNGWYWWHEGEPVNGPYNTAHAAYLAAFHREDI